MTAPRRPIAAEVLSRRVTRTTLSTPPRFTWARAGDLDPDLRGDPDHFIAFDGETEVGTVKFLSRGQDEGSWLWSLWLTHEGRAFNRPTNGTTPTRLEAARELRVCWHAFRAFYAIEE